MRSGGVLSMSLTELKCEMEENNLSRDWTPEELAAASAAMKAEGHMSYEEFCEELERVGMVAKTAPLAAGNELQRPHSTGRE